MSDLLSQIRDSLRALFGRQDAIETELRTLRGQVKALAEALAKAPCIK